MLPGDPEFFECHNCGQIVSRPTLLSGNTFGAELYSDGKQIAPMLPEFPSITKCPKCHRLFWLDEGHRIDINLFEEDEVIEAEFLSPAELNRALESNMADNREVELYLRQRIMWGINDRIRIGLHHFADYEMKVLWESNLLRLLAILDESSVDEKILAVEIYRNMGAYNKSRELILSLENDNRYDWLVKQFLAEINKRNKSVFQFDLRR